MHVEEVEDILHKCNVLNGTHVKKVEDILHKIHVCASNSIKFFLGW